MSVAMIRDMESIRRVFLFNPFHFRWFITLEHSDMTIILIQKNFLPVRMDEARDLEVIAPFTIIPHHFAMVHE